MPKQLLFSITKKDFIVQTFRAGGKGGQKQNKTNSGVRIIHKESNARGESRTLKSQPQNKKLAFKRLLASSKFKLWHTNKVWELINKRTIEEKVEEMTHPDNLKVSTACKQFNQFKYKSSGRQLCKMQDCKCKGTGWIEGFRGEDLVTK